MHRYEHGQFWPNLQQSAANFIGEGKGLGYNINIPLNSVSTFALGLHCLCKCTAFTRAILFRLQGLC